MQSPASLMLLELIRAREQGASFADCWPRALMSACSRHPDAGEWLEALSATRGAWERAFYGRTSRVEEVLSLLREGRTEPIAPERHCALWGCDGDMSERVPQARYCSNRCARRAAHMREHVRELMAHEHRSAHQQIDVSVHAQSTGPAEAAIEDESSVTH